jgi:hypothetical protein
MGALLHGSSCMLLPLHAFAAACVQPATTCIICTHIYPTTTTPTRYRPESLVTAGAAEVLGAMLLRGFTTVRDAGGADWGLARAVEEGAVLGPRVLFTGEGVGGVGEGGWVRGCGEKQSHSHSPPHIITALHATLRPCPFPDRRPRRHARRGGGLLRVRRGAAGDRPRLRRRR